MFLWETVPQRGAVRGAVIGIQTFGDFLGFHPHGPILCADEEDTPNSCGNPSGKVTYLVPPVDQDPEQTQVLLTPL